MHHGTASVASGRAGALSLGALVRAMRPKQWAKNGMVFLALLFSVNQYWSPADMPHALTLVLRCAITFALFSVLASAEYLLNDLRDAPQDRLHPKKRFRPIASGQVTPLQAVVLASVLATVGLLGSYLLSPSLLLITGGYGLLMIGYSLGLKQLVIVDVFIIAIGFVARAAGGAVAIGVPISPWLYMVTILGALFLALEKRRHELTLLQGEAAGHRRNFEEYTPQLVDQMISVVASSTVIAYSLYTFTAEGLPKNHAMMLTVPVVLYGIFRYLYLVHVRDEGGSPEDVLYSDVPLILCILLWVALSAWVLLAYRGA